MAYKPQVITVSNGGTGNETLTNHGLLIGAATGSITQLGAGNAGQVLQSGGASADPVYSTATYPSTSSLSGNIVTSNGTNFVSVSTLMLTSKFTLTSSQIKDLSGTPITLLNAPGNNKVINLVAATCKFTYGGTNQFTGGSQINLYTRSSVSSVYATLTIFNATIINSALTTVQTQYPISTNPNINTEGNQVIISVATSDFAGNAANDNTLDLIISYFVTDLT